MELETLEIFIEANIEKFSEQIQRIMPLVEQTMGRLENFTGQSIGKTEKNLDVGDGVNNMQKQLDQLTKMYEKNMETLEKITTSTTNNVEKGLSKGFTSARKTVNKDVDSLIKDINSKMGRAKAEQEKLAFLQAQRQDASSKGDTKNVVKYDTQIARAQEMMNKYQSSAKQMADSIKNELKSLPQNMDLMSDEMLNNERVIESQKAKVKELTALYEQQAKKVSKLSRGQQTALFEKYGSTFDPGYQKEYKQAGFKFQDNKESKRTGAELTKQQANIQKLIAKNDALQRSYSEAEDRTRSLRSAVKGLNTELGNTSVKTGNAALGTKKLGQGAEKSKQLFSRFGGVFNRTSNNIAHGSRRMSSGMGAFSQSMKYLLPSLIVYQLIGTAIRKMTTGLWSALKTNEEFNSSLNQIKVNMLTAFYPIYTAILPPLNALMRALATVTGQIAHFTASIFGTTYTAAKQGAQGLYQNVQAMNDTGNSADKNREKVKKLQRSLMGFDEINRIGLQEDKEETPKLDNNSVNFNTPVPAMPDWIGKANNILRDFFKPFQDSWAKHGQTVIKAWKYALGEIIQLAKAIGNSFMDVWTNGTGEKFISNILILLATMLNIVGDIAKAFRIAWDENERGTKLIQSAFNALNSILELANEIGKSFRDAWAENQIGISIFGNLLEIITNINDTISNFASGLKEAWTEGAVGQSIFHTILTMIDNMLGSINKMTKATAEWADKLDFTPLLKSIDGLLKSIEPLTKNVFDGIGWFYENILLPLAGFTITEVIPNFFDLLSGAIDVVNSVINALKPLGKWLWDSFLKPMAEWTGGVIVDVLGGVAKALKAISDWIDNHSKGFSDFVLVVGTFAATLKAISMLSTIAGVLSSVFTGLASIGGLSGVISAVGTAIGGVIAVLGGPLTIAVGAAVGVGVLLWKNWDTIKEKAGELGAWIGEKWEGIKTATSEKWESVKTKTKETWDNVSSKVKETSTTAWNNVKDKWEGIKKSTGDNFETAKNWTREKWDNIKNKVSDSSSTARQNASNAWSTMKSNINTYNDNIKTNTRKAFDSVVGWAKGLGGDIGSKLSAGFKAVQKGAKEIGKGIWEFPMKAVNGVIKGVAWVLDKVGATDTAKGMKEYVFKYAQGTGYHPGGMALVNDGYGANFREAYQLPNGQTGLFPNKRNLMVDLPAGSSVLSGPRTASMLNGGIPAYAGGVGKWFKEKWEGVKEFTGDVWDYMSHPSKLVEVGVSKFTNLKGALDPALSISKGAISTSMDAATSLVKNAMDEFFSGGDADTSTTGTMGVMQYLSDIASDVMKKYPGMVATSGYRHGDPYSHGKRQAIDIAFPSSMNGSSQYFAPANYAFEKFRDKVAYVITQGKVRDCSGMSGTGSSGQWRSWPDNDHYDHLHINGSIAQGQGGGGSSPKGSGVDRWRGPINQAANRMKQSITPSQVNGILAQIALESGGNDKAIQGAGVWDVNMANGNPAQGLLQYIPQTFNAFRVRGFGQILNGFHQLMAFFNNSNWRNDIQYGRSGWGPRGHRIQPYAKGTPYMPEDQIALLHKGEMVVPAEFNPYNNMADFQTLQMPELFRENQKPVKYVYTPEDRNIGGGMNEYSENIINAVMMALNMRGDDNQQQSAAEIIMQIDQGVLGKAVINEINKITKQQGVTPIIQ
ncbi:phage tail protein [Vagococcus hydrophili]|uniref:Phage tail protein n=1 Tax=Vagococcus hydrophili TaxID=2714947 RepID=A0A6G8APM9_9ENTE|nr:phage tail protein [Vagococcus hydrophili]QIL47031.1 phage tail protein [Vagococcus hydrophili]